MSKNKFDKLIERIYYTNCSGIQINIMDIGSIYAAGRVAATASGGNVDAITAAVVGRVAEVRQN